MVNGLTINKTMNLKMLKDIDFIVFELINPWY